jgi:hypothetical protein
MFHVDGCRGSILLTNTMNAGSVAIGGNIFFENLRPESTVSEKIVDSVKVGKPSLTITSTSSFAMARLEYGKWSSVEAGMPLWP